MLKLFGNKNKNEFMSAVILCAGSSIRFGTDKQKILLGGKPVCEHTIKTFQNSKEVNEIIVVVPKDDIDFYKQLVTNGGYDKVKAIVVGGETRQSSAFRGFKHISEKAKYVCIHDGARCLVTEDIIFSVYNGVILSEGAAAAATKITDTVKEASRDHFVEKTLDREKLWSIQTPQIFDVEIYKKAIEAAVQNDFVGTDDCGAVELAGFKVKLVETGKENLKITYKNDIKLAELILKSREVEK